MKTFLLPDSTSKIFINVCENETIKPATSTAAKSKKVRGQRWNVPYCLTPPREDLDKGELFEAVQQHCTVSSFVSLH